MLRVRLITFVWFTAPVYNIRRAKDTVFVCRAYIEGASCNTFMSRSRSVAMAIITTNYHTYNGSKTTCNGDWFSFGKQVACSRVIQSYIYVSNLSIDLIYKTFVNVQRRIMEIRGLVNKGARSGESLNRTLLFTAWEVEEKLKSFFVCSGGVEEFFIQSALVQKRSGLEPSIIDSFLVN